MAARERLIKPAFGWGDTNQPPFLGIGQNLWGCIQPVRHLLSGYCLWCGVIKTVMVWGDWQRLCQEKWPELDWLGDWLGESEARLHNLSSKCFGGQTHSHHFMAMLFLITAPLRTSANIIYVQTACRESTERWKYGAKLLLLRWRRRLNHGLVLWRIC